MAAALLGDKQASDLTLDSRRHGRTEKSIRFLAKRWVYSDMLSFSSQSAICCRWRRWGKRGDAVVARCAPALGDSRPTWWPRQTSATGP